MHIKHGIAQTQDHRHCNIDPGSRLTALRACIRPYMALCLGASRPIYGRYVRPHSCKGFIGSQVEVIDLVLLVNEREVDHIQDNRRGRTLRRVHA